MLSLQKRSSHPGRALADAGMFLFGLMLFALAQVLSLYSNLGAYSWTVLHDGMSQQTPLSIGQATQVIGLLMLFIAWWAGISPGVGTVANMLMYGLFVDLIIWSDVIPLVEYWPYRIVLLISGATVLGLAAAICLKADLGVGPRDSFMLATVRRTGLRISKVRWLMEFTAVGVGVLLGGQFGIGTILFGLIAALSVDFFYRVFNLPIKRSAPNAMATTGD